MKQVFPKILEHISPLGKVLLPISPFLFVISLIFHSYFSIVFLIFFAVEIIFLPLILISIPKVHANFKVQKKRIQIGMENNFETELDFNHKIRFFPLTFKVAINEETKSKAVPVLKKNVKIKLPLSTERRKVIKIHSISLVKTDPFSLFFLKNQIDCEFEVFVYPKIIQIPSFIVGRIQNLDSATSKNIVSDDIDFSNVRDWVPSDNLKNISWKHFAKFDKPIVRVWNESNDHSVIMIINNSFSDFSNASLFEDGVSIMASIANLLENNANQFRQNANSKLSVIYSGEREKIVSNHVEQIIDHFCHFNLEKNAATFDKFSEYIEKHAINAVHTFILIGDLVNYKEMRKKAQILNKSSHLIFVQISKIKPSSHAVYNDFELITINSIDDLSPFLKKAENENSN